jgi:hypothetical protein
MKNVVVCSIIFQENAMKTSLLMASLVAALFALPAMAQPGPGMGGQGMGPGMSGQRGAMDCARMKNPQPCQARLAERQKAREVCQGKTGSERRLCMQQNMPPLDCSKAPNAERCTLHQRAREACKDKIGPEHRQCLRDILVPKQ